IPPVTTRDEVIRTVEVHHHVPAAGVDLCISTSKIDYVIAAVVVDDVIGAVRIDDVSAAGALDNRISGRGAVYDGCEVRYGDAGVSCADLAVVLRNHMVNPAREGSVRRNALRAGSGRAVGQLSRQESNAA